MDETAAKADYDTFFLRLDRARGDLLEELDGLDLSHADRVVWAHLLKIGDTVLLETLTRTIRAGRLERR